MADSKDDETKGGKRVHRLSEMTTKEVSLVDVPANKQEFLIVKNAAGVSEQIPVERPGVPVAKAEAKAPAAPISKLDAEARGRILDAVEKTMANLGDLSAALRTPGFDQPHVADGLEVTSSLSATADTIKQAFAGTASQEAPKVATETETKKDAAAPTPTAVETKKVGRPMNGDRLSRLKNCAKAFKETIALLKSGHVALEKFDSIASDLDQIVGECDVAKFLAARAATKKMVGASDIRGVTALAPNAGAGVQPDTSTVAGAEAVFGDSVPAGVAELMKRHDATTARLEAELKKRDEALTVLRGDVVQLKKFRRAPAAIDEGGDSEAESVLLEKGAKFDPDEEVVWANDMAAEMAAEDDED